MRIRLRAPNGQSALNLTDTASVQDLLVQIVEKTSIMAFDLKYGYPPKPLEVESIDQSLLLSQLGVALNNETLIVSPKIPDEPMQATVQSSRDTEDQEVHSLPEEDTATHGVKTSGPVALKRKIIAEDVPELPLPDRGATLGNPG